MAMNLGAYTACLHNFTLPEALDHLKSFGLTGAEVNVGGFIPSPHCPVDLLIGSKTAREDYLGIFEEKGMRLAGLNTSGNVLDPLPDVGPRHTYDLKRAIELAGKLGVGEIVCMSGLPGTDPDAKYPACVVNPWNGEQLEVLEYQYGVLEKFWKEMDQRAQEAGVKLAWELHPTNTVFTPTQFLEFDERVGGFKNIGVNMDPSHLMWQGMDIMKSIELLGDKIVHVHAKDTKIEPGVATRGVLDPSFEPVPEDESARTPVGMDHYCSSWPSDPAWRFVAIGEGHDVPWWSEFLAAIDKIDPEMNINIEHEDAAYDQLEGIRLGAENLIAAQSA